MGETVPKSGDGWRRIARHVTVAAAALAALLATNAYAKDLTTINVANFRNAVVLPLFYGMDKGYFKEAGLDVKVVNIATGPASVSAVASGQADIGWAAVAVPMFARANGVAVKLFMTANEDGPPNHYDGAILASGRSGITSIAQIKGKTVMINAFGTATELQIRQRLQAAGVSWDDVKKVVVPFPQMPAALALGNADVAVVINPMRTQIMNDKATAAKMLSQGVLMESSTRPIAVSGYFATDSWLAKNRDAAIAFGRAYRRAAKEIQASEQLRLDLMVKLLGMKLEVAKMVPDVTWFQNLSVEKASVAPNYDALVKTGMMKANYPVDDVIVKLPF
jgi:ABC-type nitrate/sulfonate/bicarbonate transport system substrate-binding protein